MLEKECMCVNVPTWLNGPQHKLKTVLDAVCSHIPCPFEGAVSNKAGEHS